MRSKTAIQFFAIALALICVYQLSFTVVSYIEEQKAEQYAAGDNEKRRQYLDSIAYKPVYDLLVREYTYREVKERSLNLGLDLQGGMHVTLEVAIDKLINRLANNPSDASFQRALSMARERQATSQESFVDLFYESLTELNPEVRLGKYFYTRENQGNFDNSRPSNEEVLDFLRDEAENGLDRTFNILSTRIDRFGVTQPNIQKQEGTNRIMVELPGVDDPERVRNILQGAAKLEFWETYDNIAFNTYLEDANKALASVLGTTEGDDTTRFDDDDDDDRQFFQDEDTTPAVITTPDTVEGDDDGGLMGESDDTTTQDTNETLSEEEFQEQNPLYAVMMPNVRQAEEGLVLNEGPVIGYANGTDTGKVNSYLSIDAVASKFPALVKFVWSAKPAQGTENTYALLALKMPNREGEPQLDGRVITDARVDLDQFGKRTVIMSMNQEGSNIWAKMTRANVGKSVAIVLDNKAFSWPRVNTEITGGVSSIEGVDETNEAEDLVNILKSGKLPLQVDIVEEAVVGPSLGRESVRNGLLSLLAGFVLVIIFMAFYYNKSGLVANAALLINLFFIIGILASLGSALTLPGMAGIVLTIGMSVDANVLIFERIREELRAGKGIKLAIADGYRNAYSSIIDANLTTLLVGIVLWTFGSGPIHGFAVVLVIGILTSLFSAVLITRLIYDWLLTRDKVLQFGTEATSKAFSNTNVDFLGKRKLAYIISGAVIAIGIISLSIRGVDYGVDFSGGYSYVVEFTEPADGQAIRNALTPELDGRPEVKTFGGNTKYKITTDYLINDTASTAATQVQEAVNRGLAQIGEFEVIQVSKVGPTIAQDIKTSAAWAVGFALVIIFLYIFIRFRKWQYGLGALVALFHDVLFIFGLFSILQNIVPFTLEVDQAFIAAILTVVGYSINDTVIVFDRVRENLTLHKSLPMFSNINAALNSTISRTMVTSGTTFLVIFVLFLFGGEIIRGFSFAILMGILVGTYSSLFIATPIVVDLNKRDRDEWRSSGSQRNTLPVEEKTTVTR